MLYLEFEKQTFKKTVAENIKNLYRRTLKEATPQQIFQAVSYAVKDVIIDNWMKTQAHIEQEDSKIVYYLSMEFLTGRALGNDLIALTVYDEVKEAMDELGVDLNVIEDQEPDPALGNGGLGRLAACFLDSLATLGYPAYGCGIRYRYGMFKQRIQNGCQQEVPDNWLREGNPFELRRPEYAKEVKFGGYVRVQYNEKTKRNDFIQEGYQSVRAIPYDMPVVGYNNGMVNTLRIWDAEAVSDFQLDSFDKGDYHKAVEQENLARTIVEVLYPNDNHLAGKELRLKQQYFFISASLQTAIEKYKKQHSDIGDLHKKVVFQMNDTHPAVAVPELMRILIDEEGLTWDEAWKVTTHACAYTNHTIMSEALEKWPVDLFSRLLPRVYQMIEEINRRFVEHIRFMYPGDESKVASMAILYDGQVRMANLAIVGSFSVNGVAHIQTEILEKRELRNFYEMMPEKFNNKTNGITQRRFLMHANPLLADWVTKYVGEDWITNLPVIERLMPFADNEKVQREFLNIKYLNKVRLAKYIKEHNHIDVDPHSIFDVQVKRLHEYKRQFMNILRVMYLYNLLKENPDMEFYPRTFIFGGKASAGYERAKEVINLINNVGEVINNDPDIKGRIKVVFIEDYRVSNAELIFAAADISEQISTASKEASGTGNMKFMINGAVTLGTMDGANVEIVEEAGRENVEIFGFLAQEIIDYEKNGGYNPLDYYNRDPELKKVLDQLINGEYSCGDKDRFRDIHDSLLVQRGQEPADMYFILGDFKSYITASQKMESRYRDRRKWAKTAIINIAKSGKFSSDRTIFQYVEEIWHLDKILL